MVRFQGKPLKELKNWKNCKIGTKVGGDKSEVESY